MVKLDHENEDEIMRSSPMRLIVGGRARLARLPSIHQVPSKGSMVCRPWAKIRVRL